MYLIGIRREVTVANVCYYSECFALEPEEHSCEIRGTYVHAAESAGSSMSGVEQRDKDKHGAQGIIPI